MCEFCKREKTVIKDLKTEIKALLENEDQHIQDTIQEYLSEFLASQQFLHYNQMEMPSEYGKKLIYKIVVDENMVEIKCNSLNRLFLLRAFY